MNDVQRCKALTNPILTLLTMALVVLAGCSQQSAPASGVAELILVDGETKVRKAGRTTWEPARTGTRLSTGDRFWVKSGKARIEYDANDSLQEVLEGTIIEVNGARPVEGTPGLP